MNINKKIATGPMTAIERIHGRYMRAPDHDASTGNGEGGGDSSGGEGQAAGNDDSDAGLTTAEKLEKEFGYDDSPATGNDDSSSTGDDEDGEDDEEGEGDDADGDDSDDSDESGEEGDSKEGEEAEAGKDSKPKTRAQQRIDELTASARQAERDADYWRRRAEELGAKPENATGDDDKPLEEPDPSKYQYGEHDLDYIKDRAKFDAKVEVLEEQATARFKSEAAALEAKWNTTLAKNAEKYPDFEEKVVKAGEKGEWKCPPVIAVGIKDSEYGADIAYKLATNPTEADRLARLTPLEQAREFGRLEQDFVHSAKITSLEAEIAKLKGKAEASGKPAPKIVSTAPKPPSRRSRGTGVSSEVAADTDDFAAFERMADAKMGIKG